MRKKKIDDTKPTEKQYQQAVNILANRNKELESEVGRLHMVNKAYEQQFADMREAISQLQTQVKSDEIVSVEKDG